MPPVFWRASLNPDEVEEVDWTSFSYVKASWRG